MDNEQTKLVERLTRPIVSLENRTPLEVFDMMSDRILAALQAQPAPAPDGDVLKGPKNGVNCAGCGVRLPPDYPNACPDCGMSPMDSSEIAALAQKDSK